MASRTVSALEVGQTYLQLHHAVHRLVDQSMTSAGLSLARAKVLARLCEGGPMNQATLAGLLGLAPRTVTETVDALERDGLVTRGEDQRDRRAHIVTVTPAGCEMSAAAQVIRRRAMNRIFGVLTADERGTLSGLLTTIHTNVASGEDCVN